MPVQLDDICLAPDETALIGPQPFRPGIYPASVYRCDDPDQANRLLAGQQPGYVYQRDGHPNADWLAEKCRQLHGAAWAEVTSSGMAALSAAALTLLETGDHVIVSDRLYGRTAQLFTQRLARFGVTASVLDMASLEGLASAVTTNTKMLVVETITNPMLRVTDLPQLADLAGRQRLHLLVDNTLASPYVCQPLKLGATLVMESVSKMINGHSDCMLGLLCGNEPARGDFRSTMSIWGLTSSPFDCWLAHRGLATLPLRMQRACDNARRVAEFLQSQSAVTDVYYPGLASHPDHALARRILQNSFGNLVTFDLSGRRAAAERFIAGSRQIPFCPSLGEVSTTLSHPASTSHRALEARQRERLGITEGTIRLSVGCESWDYLRDALIAGLSAA